MPAPTASTGIAPTTEGVAEGGVEAGVEQGDELGRERGVLLEDVGPLARQFEVGLRLLVFARRAAQFVAGDEAAGEERFELAVFLMQA